MNSGNDYILIRSDRRTVSIDITDDLCVRVRAPRRMPRSAIDALIAQNTAKIDEMLAVRRARRQVEQTLAPDAAAEERLKERARALLPERVARYAALMGLSCAGVKITGAKRRLGSCSAKNSICFSWRLMMYGDRVIDYVVVHELAHIREKNHSARFYAVIEKYMPDYKSRIKELKAGPQFAAQGETV